MSKDVLFTLTPTCGELPGAAVTTHLKTLCEGPVHRIVVFSLDDAFALFQSFPFRDQALIYAVKENQMEIAAIETMTDALEFFK